MVVQSETCDVCVVGAGLAGVNALAVASKYLTSGQRVILVDRRERSGGMWVDTYPYVRLHQPHGMFTAGDIKWTLNAKPSHLASKGEVLDHFQHCLDVVRRDVRVDEFFGWDMTSDAEADGIVRITCTSADGRTLAVDAKKLIKAYGFRIQPQTGNFVLGVLSSEEKNVITAGLNDVVCDYLVDVVDDGDTTEMVLRGGGRRVLQRGSWIVNCTGYVNQRRDPYEPYVSASGNVQSINPRSAVMHLSSFTGYFGTHLMFRGELRDTPLYELDKWDLLKKSKKAFPYALFTLMQHNISLMADRLPNKVFRECGLDFARWYPAPRQLMAAATFMRTHRAERERHRRTLDEVRERFDIRCGPLA